MQIIDNLPPIVAILIGALALFWVVLALLVPFMIEGIRQSAKKSHDELIELNEKIDRLTALLGEAAERAPSAGAPNAAAHAGGAARGRATVPAERTSPRRPADEPARGRREPTISGTEIEGPAARPNRREPVVR